MVPEVNVIAPFLVRALAIDDILRYFLVAQDEVCGAVAEGLGRLGRGHAPGVGHAGRASFRRR